MPQPDGNAPLTLDDGATLETPNLTTTVEDLADDDADIAESTVELDHRGAKGQFVPAGAIATERKARRAATTKVKELEGQLGKAVARAAAAETDLSKAMPVLQALSQRPDLIAAISQTQPSTRQPTTAVGESEVPDAEAREIAELYELFDAQGQPDIARGRRAALRERNMVRAAVEKGTAPLRNATIAEKSQANRSTLDRYVEQGDFSREALDAVLSMVPAELLADKGVMSVLYYTALGIDKSKGGGKRAPARETTEAPGDVIHTEGTGRRPNNNAALSDVEEIVARNRGLSREQFKSHLKDLPEFGSPITLE